MNELEQKYNSGNGAVDSPAAQKPKMLCLFGYEGSRKNELEEYLLQNFPNDFIKTKEYVSFSEDNPVAEEHQIPVDFEKFAGLLMGGDVIDFRAEGSNIYGIKKSSLSLDKINVAALPPKSINNLLENYSHDIDITAVYVASSDKDIITNQFKKHFEGEYICTQFLSDQQEIDKFEIEENNYKTFILLNNSSLEEEISTLFSLIGFSQK